MTFDRTHDLYERVTTLRSETFELLGRMRTPGFTTPDLALVSDRLQGIANQLGAVETLVAHETA
jgi:hypothetical protein